MSKEDECARKREVDRKVRTIKRSSDLPPRPPPVVGFADVYTGGFVDEFHTHDRAQLAIYQAGSVTISIPDSIFVLCPGQAMWMPANTLHQSICRTDLMFQVIYVDPILSGADLECKVFDASTLVQGLVDEIVAMKSDFTMDARMSTIAALLLEEVRRAPRLADRVHLPADSRLRRVCEAVMAQPGDRHDIDFWAREAGMSRRSFTRLFQQEMGAGFAAWRRRVRVIEAASRITAGETVAEVAFALGYDGLGSFSTMFRQVFGVSPSSLKARSLSLKRS